MNRSLHAIAGALRLARLDASGLAAFDTGWAGARHSFLALLWATPLLLAMILAQDRIYQEIEFGAAAITARLASALLGWLAFVLLLFPITRLLNRAERTNDFITVFNWAQLVTLFLQAPPLLLGSLGLVSFGGYGFLVLSFLLIALIYKGYVATVALNIAVIEAVLLVIAELLFDVSAELLLMRLFMAL